MNKYSFHLITDYNVWNHLESEVYTGLKNKNVFSLLSESEFYERIKLPNRIIGIWDEDLLIGYVIYKLPDKSERKEFDIIDNNTVLLDGLAVKKQYRGQGLQLVLMNAFEAIARENHFCSIVASVHPDNIFSLSNFIKNHYFIIAEKDLSYGHRYILKKTVRRDNQMKILGICGSPRKGNSETLLHSILNSLNNKHETDCIILSESKLEYCKGCLSCSTTNECCTRDDMDIFRDKLIAADTIILTTPVYWDDVPAILKNFIDRTNPFSKQLAGKNIYIVVCGMADEISWNGAINMLKNYCSIVGMNCIGASSFYAKGPSDITSDTIEDIIIKIKETL